MSGLERILVTSSGSRGDIQPYIAVALALRDAGYVVLVATNADHADFVQSFGLQFHAVFSSCQKNLEEDKAFQKAMETGELKHFAKAMKESADESNAAREMLVAWKDVLDTFQPNLMIGGTFSGYLIQLSSRKLNVPALPLELTGLFLFADPKRTAYGAKTLPLGLSVWLMKKVILPETFKGMQKVDDTAQEVFGVRAFPKRMSMKRQCRRALDPQTPFLIASGPLYGKVLYDHLPEKQHVRFTGTLVLEREAQVQNAKEGQSSFGEESTLRAVEAFLSEGTRPVYMGWGSMTVRSPEFMIRLALEALRLSGLRAVILGGWAKLSVEVLDPSSAMDNALIQYAEKNVLVIKSAPHEWLLPQCACTVHHGGAGTTNAAVRAGVPTIITPCFLDQFDWAHVVNKLGNGFGLQHFSKITPRELADALRKCTTDNLISMRATEVAAQLRQEDGAQGVLREVEAFWSDWVQTGRYEKVLRQEADEDEAPPKGCLGNRRAA